MKSAFRITGYAIVSRDGMLADAAGIMPPQMIVEADQNFFESGLDASVAAIHGRNSQENFATSPQRKRLIASRSVLALAPDPSNANALLWNPQGASCEDALHALGVKEGTVAIIGGTSIFGLFLPLYDTFNLSRADDVVLPGGRPVFPQVPADTPENILKRYGLQPGSPSVLDPLRNIRVVTWTR